MYCVVKESDIHLVYCRHWSATRLIFGCRQLKRLQNKVIVAFPSKVLSVTHNIKIQLKINNHFSEPGSVSPTDDTSKSMVHCRFGTKLAISSLAVYIRRCSPPSCYNDGESREEGRWECGEEYAGEKGLGKSRHRRLKGNLCGFVMLSTSFVVKYMYYFFIFSQLLL